MPMQSKKRLKKLLKLYAVVLLIGAGYAVLCLKTGIGIPCVFYRLTGLNCVSCGVTRMLTSLISGNLYDAYSYNRLLFIFLPFFLFYFIRESMRYVKYGNFTYSEADKLLFAVFISSCVIFGIGRNIDVIFGI